MKRTSVSYSRGFEVLVGNAQSQAGTLVLAPGETTGGPDNRHGGADQWIYVVSGAGLADIAGERFDLTPSMLVLIERGEPHGFRNTGEGDLCLLTFYAPPAYDADGNELPAGLP
jgi:mannose-6-phosphate isomerase-like protein (cupin superfamily)